MLELGNIGGKMDHELKLCIISQKDQVIHEKISSLPEITEHLGCKAYVLWLSNRAQSLFFSKKYLIHSG